MGLILLSPLIVMVDQFEEIYSLCDDKTERTAFIENLLHAAGDRRGRVCDLTNEVMIWVVLAMGCLRKCRFANMACGRLPLCSPSAQSPLWSLNRQLVWSFRRGVNLMR